MSTRDVIKDGIATERICWDVVGCLQLIARDMHERQYPDRTVCGSCGGLRANNRLACDVCKALAVAGRRDYMLSEVEWLIGTDMPESIARRLGYLSVESMARFLQREGRHDLARHFWRKDKGTAA
jgi:hypothetical protein